MSPPSTDSRSNAATPSSGWLARLLHSPLLWRVTLGLLLVVVTYLALTPAPPASVDTGWDKMNHALAFSALSLSASFSGSRSRRWVFLTGVLLLIFGGAIEIVQVQVGRDGEWADLLADGVGTAVGLTAALLLARLSFSARAR